MRLSGIIVRCLLAAASVAVLAGCNESANSPTQEPTQDAPGSIPSKPTNLAATSGDAAATLTWSASSGANWYYVWRSTTSEGPYTAVAAPASTSFADSALANGTTYYYMVSAMNAVGQSAGSAEVSATPVAAALPPFTPTDLVATNGNAQASLAWSATNGAAGYRVMRSTTNGGPYTQIGTPTLPSFDDSPLTNDTTYYYVISAINAIGESANSLQVSATPTAPILPPSTPINLAATGSSGQVSLTWSASSGATSYRVKRSTTNGGSYAQVTTVTTTSYTNTSLTNGTTYYYVVTAINSVGESANSAQASATPTAPPPSAPANLVATGGNAQASLTWSASSGATSYRVKRSSTNGGPYNTQVASPTATSLVDTSLTNGTTYYYVVTAVSAAGESANSTQASAAPAAPILIPDIPLNLMAVPGDRQVALIWAPAVGASGYYVKRSTNSGGPYTQVTSTSSLAYTDTSLTNGMNYFYVIVAFNAAGASANSAQVSAQPDVPTPPPVTFGTWMNVTPSNASAAGSFGCGNYGSTSVQADPAHPGHVYTQFNCQGIWKSTNYGATWTGPINTGTNGAAVGDCAGGITIPPSSTASVPVIYEACIRGSGLGFWRSLDGGVNWTRYSVAPGGGRQDYYAPVVDPYDPNHLLMAGHEMNSLVESVDGGQTWTDVPVNSGMLQSVGTASIFFINMGNASATRKTWLYLGQMTGGNVGTWRSANGGQSWTQVDRNEHPHGSSQIYQPDNNGVLYMAGLYSASGWGVLRSTDYGQTWSHVGLNANETVVVGTSKNLYSMFGWPQGAGGVQNPAFMLGAQPGTGTWVAPATPAGLTQGAAWIQVVNDGTHNILIGSMWNAGLWRYIEP